MEEDDGDDDDDDDDDDDLLTHYMEQSLSWEASRFSACQEILCVLSNTKVYYHVCKCRPPVLILSQINPLKAPPPQIPLPEYPK